MYDANEPWKAEVNGEIYETTFGELTEWIAEGALITEDKVKRGELRWLKAGMVPPLRPFFEAKTNGTAPPLVSMTVADVEEGVNVEGNTLNPELSEDAAHTEFVEGEFNQGEEHAQEHQGEEHAEEHYLEESFSDEPGEGEEINQSVCSVHPEIASKFVCTTCSHGFCKECPQAFGSSVRICPYCGAMCREIGKLQAETGNSERIQRDIAEGFGAADFVTALGYPFRFGTSFVFGGIIVAILAYGQAAMGMGSFVLAGFGIVCFVISTAFVFAMLSNTVNNFAKGEIDKNFINFEDFDIWEDMLHPFFLYIGAAISSFGPAIVLTIVFVWYAFSTISAQLQPPQTANLDVQESQQSIDHVAKVKRKLQEQNKLQPNVQVGEDGLTDAQRRTLNEEAEFQRLSDFAGSYKQKQLESTIGPSPEVQAAQQRQIINSLLKTAGVFLIFFLIFYLWGFFYFPAAAAVAGYTRSFAATINPAVGLDTIRHLGLDYLKIFLMMFGLGMVTFFIGAILGILLSPFNLPGVGNLPVTVLSGFVSFYSWIVFAVILGLALYKNSDKLALAR